MLLNHQITGAGPVLLILHGLFGNSGNWKSISRKLAESFTVVTVDLRNHGRSDWSDDVRYLAMAADIGSLLDHLDYKQATLIGHSMGGKTAMTFALLNPARVSGLVVVDIAPVVYSHSHIDLINTLIRLDIGSARSRKDIDAMMAEEIPEPGLRMFLSQNLVFQENQFKWRINLKALAEGMSELTGFPDLNSQCFHSPCLFLYGTSSDYVLDHHRPKTLQLFPAAEFVGIEGAGHWAHAEAPQRVIDEVHTYAQKVGVLKE